MFLAVPVLQRFGLLSANGRAANGCIENAGHDGPRAHSHAKPNADGSVQGMSLLDSFLSVYLNGLHVRTLGSWIRFHPVYRHRISNVPRSHRHDQSLH